MDCSRILTALAVGLTSAAHVFAQQRGETTPIPPSFSQPGPYFPAVPVVPVQTVPPTEVTPLPGIPFPRAGSFAIIPPPPPGRAVVERREQETYSAPVKIELNDGTFLSGEIHSDGPLHCTAIFGQTAIPFSQIKGLAFRNATEQPDDHERKATLILVNGDALTVSVTMPTIQVKTTWGHASVELSQVRSMILTIEKVEWADTPDGRRILVPAAGAPETQPK